MKTLDPTLSVDVSPGGFAEGCHWQQHVGELRVRILERAQRHHQTCALQCGSRGGSVGGIEGRLDAEQQQPLHRSGQHLAGVEAALTRQRVDPLRADTVGRVTEIAHRGTDLSGDPL